MAEQERKIKAVIASTPSEAALQTIDELEANNISLEEFLGPEAAKKLDEPKIPLTNEANTLNESENLEQIVNYLASKQEIPGSSLTRSPDEAYAWERPPLFTSPREAQDAMFNLLSTPEVAENIVRGLRMGFPVVDLASLLVFKAFVDGAFNPDVALLLGEPVAYFIMALGERANIDYKIENDDSDIDDVVDSSIDDKALIEIEKAGGINKIQKTLQKKDISVKDIPAEIVEEVEEKIPASLLAADADEPIEQTTSDSLLDRK